MPEVLLSLLFCGVININIHVVTRVSIATRVVHPKIETSVYQFEPQRIFIGAYYRHAAVYKPMLINNHWLLCDSSAGGVGGILFSLETLRTRDPKNCINVAVFRGVKMLFQRVP